jgi:hypothetical protein
VGASRSSRPAATAAASEVCMAAGSGGPGEKFFKILFYIKTKQKKYSTTFVHEKKRGKHRYQEE